MSAVARAIRPPLERARRTPWAGRARAIALYGLLTIVGLWCAYYALFNQFVPYDDEGTLLTTLRPFVAGDVLYRDIYTPYGPFYYEVFGALFAFSGRPVTTDSSRLIVVGVWTGVSLLVGLVVQRITGRLALGAAGMAVAFTILHQLKVEPMHPVGLVLLLYAGLALAVTSASLTRARVAAGLAGALVAALLLTKINVGMFAIAAVCVAAVNWAGVLHRRRWLRWTAAAAFLAMAPVLMSANLELAWARTFAVVVVIAAAAVLIADAASRDAGGAAVQQQPLRWLLVAVAGFGASAAAILAIIVANGSSLGDVLDNTLREGLRQGDIFIVPLSLPGGAVDWCLAALAVAAICAFAPGRPLIRGPWPGLLRIAAGLAIWFAAAGVSLFGLVPQSPIALPLALAWVAALRPRGVVDAPAMSFARVLLPLLAIAETLQAYPVAGTQVLAAATMFVPVGAICLADGMAALRAWAQERPAVDGSGVSFALTIVAVVVCVRFVYGGVVAPGINDAIAYRDLEPVPFSGAHRLHLSREQIAPLQRIVQLTGLSGCTALVGLPSTNSLYLWTGLRPPKPTLPSAWMTQLDDARQQRVVDQMRRSPRPCAVRNDTRANGWMNGRPLPDSPLVRYITDEFRSVETAGEYQFLLPRQRG